MAEFNGIKPVTCVQTRPAFCSLEWSDFQWTLSRFGVAPTDSGWELVINPDGTAHLEIHRACPLATMQDAHRRGSRCDVAIWDDMADAWRPMTDSILLHDRYPVRLKVDMLTEQDWED